MSGDDPQGGRPPDGDEPTHGTRDRFDRDRTFATGTAPRPADSPTLRSRVVKPTRSFADGEVIAARYAVLRFLAAGGMGEVYEVDDRELGERVALKTIRPEIAADPAALERFRREALLARKVTHPNVSRIFDIGHHRPEGVEEEEEVTFLTMELLGGETLAARLRRGRMPAEEALPLVRQIASGLAAAHRAGIVHRDLKPANVFLVPDGDQVRAVLTDFGLARTDAAGKALADMTGTGEVLGTPAYMAPEQLEGKVPTPATDIYALGLVIYEMVTGARAFVGETLFQVALQRLQGRPTAPSVHLPSLEPLWEQTILRCLEREPSERFQDAEEVSSTLSGEKPLEVRRARRRGLLRTRRGLLAAVATCALAAALVGVWYLGRHGGGTRATGTGRQAVAVLGFRNVAGDPAQEWISTALAEILTTELAAGEKLRAVPGETVARAVVDLDLKQVQTLGEDTLNRLRSNLGADLVVLGSYTVPPGGGQIRLDVRVQSASTGDVLGSWPVTGSTEELFALAAQVAAAIRSTLGVGEAAGAGTALASLAKIPEAARLYSEGVAALRRFDPLKAKELLTQAAAADPTAPLVFSELAKAWSDLGYDGEALKAAEKANQLTGGLDRENQERVKGQYLVAARRFKDAADTYRSLWTFFPDNPEYGLRLTEAQVAAGNAEEALATVEDLRRLPAPASTDPRVDLAEAKAAETLGQFERQRTAAEHAVKTGEERGARLLVADALLAEVNALIRLGDLAKAAACADQALEIMSRAGNQAGVAKAHHVRAVVAYYQGDLAAAEKGLQEALVVRRSVGDRRGEALTVNLLGGVRLAQGDLPGAREQFDRALAIHQEIGNAAGEADTLNNIALLLQRQGDLVGAVDRLNRALALFRELGDRRKQAAALENIGSNKFASGDLAGARSSYEEALGIYRQLSSRNDVASTLSGLGEVLLYQGDLKGARDRHQEALDLCVESGEKTQSLLRRYALAVISLEEATRGQRSFAEVEAELAALATTFHDQDMTEAEASALNQLADAQAKAGNTEEAGRTISRSEALLPKVSDLSARASIRMTAARIAAASDHAREGLENLHALQAEVRDSGVLGLNLELRLATAEVELRAGRVADARQALEQLRQEATARGWILIADRAAAILKG